MTPVIFRIIVSVSNLDIAADFYGKLFDAPGKRTTLGQHEFDAGPVTLACYDAESEGDDTPHVANPEPIYFAVEDIDSVYDRFDRLGLLNGYAKVQENPLGERSFYVQDPFGNPLCFVDASTCHNRSQAPGLIS